MLSVEIYFLTLAFICILCYLSHILREHITLLSLFIITTVLLLIILLILLLLISKDDFFSILSHFTIVNILRHIVLILIQILRFISTDIVCSIILILESKSVLLFFLE